MMFMTYTCPKVPKTAYEEEDTLYYADGFCSIRQKPHHVWTLVQQEEEKTQQNIREKKE